MRLRVSVCAGVQPLNDDVLCRACRCAANSFGSMDSAESMTDLVAKVHLHFGGQTAAACRASGCPTLTPPPRHPAAGPALTTPHHPLPLCAHGVWCPAQNEELENQLHTTSEERDSYFDELNRIREGLLLASQGGLGEGKRCRFAPRVGRCLCVGSFVCVQAGGCSKGCRDPSPQKAPAFG